LASPGRNIILVVDDEAIVLRTVTTILASSPYRAVVAENGLAGWEAFLKFTDEVCLVLTDVVMPVLSGIEMADRILGTNPAVKVLLMTAYTDEAVQPQNRRKLPLIRKPFLPDDLLRKIDEVVV
jgi:two-component system, cell cycle sensor histidine kinase and response regulator CckA